MIDERVSHKLTELALVFPRQDMKPEALELYAKHLSDLTSVAVCAAIDRAIETSTFPPSIGEIRGAVAALVLGDVALPEAVWSTVKAEVRRVGHNRPPTFSNGRFLPPEVPAFDDPLVAEAVEATGWQYLCIGEPEGVVKAQFERTLRAIWERAITRLQTGRMANGEALVSGNGAIGAGSER